MIKKLHYCWFGGNKKTKIIKKCIESWKKYCPDYEIIEWNENNFDVHCCQYVEEAYKAKKWAFVSDYCRFFVLYNYGGIYLDTDVEMIKSLYGLPNSFVGFEKIDMCNSGLIRGALKNDNICRLMLESYRQDKFMLEDGSFNLKTVCERETELLECFGLKRNGELQEVAGTTVFPKEYFCGKDVETMKLFITKNTYTIHHYAGSWLSSKRKIVKKMIQIFGYNFTQKLVKIKHWLRKE